MNFSEKKINAVLILEILGRPPEFLTETLEKIIKEIEGEKGVSVLNKKINPPVLMKNQKDFYTSFAEVEVETESLTTLTILMFKYMPAHVELISPQNINLKNSDFEEILNEITRRLHGYEEVARILQNEKIILENKLKEISEKNIQEESSKKIKTSPTKGERKKKK
jgi:hypothetical protein